MGDVAMQNARDFLKDTVRQTIDFSQTHQHLGIPPPPIAKLYPEGAECVELVPAGEWTGVSDTPVETAIGNRESHRRFTDRPLTLDQLSFLLWATQGIRTRVGPGTALRTVPSAGARHAFETYLCVTHVVGLEPGVYRYLPLEHRLLVESRAKDLPARLADATLGQSFTGRGAVAFVWTTIPYRMEWRYGLAAHKVIAIDIGHVCQNLYLAGECIGAGTCAIAAYDQQAMDRLVGVDGEEEFVVYLAPVGRLA